MRACVCAGQQSNASSSGGNNDDQHMAISNDHQLIPPSLSGHTNVILQQL
jgi:hypothetical protein